MSASKNKGMMCHLLILATNKLPLLRVSLSAASATIFEQAKKGKVLHILAGSIYAILYIIFTSMFGRSLKSWNYTAPGLCYNTELLATSYASHPHVDRIYVGITTAFMIFILMLVGLLRVMHKGEIHASLILFVSYFQYPLHLYSVVALRSSNEGLLDGDSENNWGFGQISALVLLAGVLFQCASGAISKSLCPKYAMHFH